ncbi:MAG TPA: hypothetical protein DHW14_00375 [Clostridiales bacterium]|nr:hypothetical protein [Clostridiales bacterium]
MRRESGAMKDIGRRLRARREELGLSLEEVQAETKIRRKYLEALEAGDESRIPGAVYLKGFLRSYANFLGLDGWELVREYRAWKEGASPGAVSQGEVSPEEETSLRARRAGRHRRRAAGPRPQAPGLLSAPAGFSGRVTARARRAGRRGLGRFWVSVLVLTVLVGAVGLWYLWAEPAGPAGGDDETGALPGVGQAPAEPDAGGDALGSAEPDTGGADTAPGQMRWALVSESAEEACYVVYGAPFTLGLEVLDRCWIRVAVDGQVVLEKTLEAGSSGGWSARKELTVRLGRPHLVRVSLEGEDLGPAGTRDAPRTLVFKAGEAPGTAPHGEETPTGGE